jgi:hypothetical protein
MNVLSPISDKSINLAADVPTSPVGKPSMADAQEALSNPSSRGEREVDADAIQAHELEEVADHEKEERSASSEGEVDIKKEEKQPLSPKILKADRNSV